MHILEKSAAFIGLHINATKTEYMLYNQNGAIETLDKTLLKKVVDFVYLSSNITSTEKYVLIRISKAWSAIDRLRAIWKSGIPKQIKKGFFRAAAELILLFRMDLLPHGLSLRHTLKHLKHTLKCTHQERVFIC